MVLSTMRTVSITVYDMLHVISNVNLNEKGTYIFLINI